MDIDFTVRTAKPDDAEVVVDMIKELATLENRLHRFKMTPQQFRKDCSGEEPFFRCIIAEVAVNPEEVKLAGYAVFYYTWSIFEGRTVYVSGLYVREDYRNHKIGSTLMNTVAKIALEKGCVAYRLACRGWNTSALRFYKSKGGKDLTADEDMHVIRFGEEEMHALAGQQLAYLYR